MARPLRLHVPGMNYHVFSRGVDKCCIFRDDVDYRLFLKLLARALSRFNARCASYCLMSNHYHLLLEPAEYPISRVMHQVNSDYCRRFNRRHQRVGHLLHGRFGGLIVDDGAYLRTGLRYIALNPVAAGMVADPREWRWSSYRFTVGPASAPEFLTLDRVWGAFGTLDAATGRPRFAEFVAAGFQDVFDSALFYGSDQLACNLTQLLKPLQGTRDYVYAQRFATRSSLGDLFDGVIRREDLEEAAHRAFYSHAYTLAEIGKVVKRDPTTVWRWIRRARGRLNSTRQGPAQPVVEAPRGDSSARIEI